jgi:Phosphotransferase enzyme family
VDPSLPFSSILRPNREGRGRPYALLFSRHRSAWLLPTESALRRTGLRAFGHRGLKGFVGRTLLAAAQLRGQRLWLDIGQLERRLAGVLGESEVHLAFCVGTSGPYRKLTAQVMTHRDQVPAYAKIAAHRLAQDALACEHRNLLRLSAIDGLRDRVPSVLGWFGWQGTQVLVVTAGGGLVGPGRLTGRHGEFLQRLHEAFADEQPFEAGAMWARLVGTVRGLAPRMPREWSLRCQMALRQLRGLGPVVLPLSVAHRDFAPWNTRLTSCGLFVFDWETAADGMTPLYDVFHFQAIQAAHAGRPFHPARGRHQELSGAFWTAWNPHLVRLYLAYLLDMGLFYLEAGLHAPDGGDERVCRWFGEQIDAYAGCGHAVA